MLLELLYNFRSIVAGPNLDERRDTPRALCNIPLACQTAKGAMIGTLKDLSARGARIFTDQKAPLNQVLLLSPPKGMGESSRAMKGKIAWCRPIKGGYMIGVKFTVAPTGWVQTVLQELGLSATPPTQQRKFVRVPSDLQVQLQAQGVDRVMKLKDLGIGGALLTGRERLARDQVVRLTIPRYRGVPELQVLAIACGCRKSKVPDNFDISLKFSGLDDLQRKNLIKRLSQMMRASLTR